MRNLTLKYTTEAEAKADLISKGIVDEELNFKEGVHAVVWIDKITLTQATFDEQGNELTPAVIADGYHVDLLLSDEITVEFTSELFPNTRRHQFQGINEEIIDPTII